MSEQRTQRLDRLRWRRRKAHRVPRPRYCPVCGGEYHGTRGLREHRRRAGH